MKEKIEAIKTAISKPENKKKLTYVGLGLGAGVTGFIGYKLGTNIATKKIADEICVIINGNEELADAFSKAVDESLDKE